MSPDRNRLQALVDSLPDNEVPADEEIVDAETLAKSDRAFAESGEDLTLEEVRKRLGL